MWNGKNSKRKGFFGIMYDLSEGTKEEMVTGKSLCWPSGRVTGVVFGVKNLDNQEVLNVDCIVSLLCAVIGIIIGISVVKPDNDKVGSWLGIILKQY